MEARMAAPETASALAPEVLKSCCADAYSGEWARLLLGDTFHPGGVALTERLGRGVRPAAGGGGVGVGAGEGYPGALLSRTVGGAGARAARAEGVARAAA